MGILGFVVSASIGLNLEVASLRKGFAQIVNIQKRKLADFKLPFPHSQNADFPVF